MMNSFKTRSILIITAFLSTGLFAFSQQSLIDQALSSGFTPQEINSALGSQNSPQNSETPLNIDDILNPEIDRKISYNDDEIDQPSLPKQRQPKIFGQEIFSANSNLTFTPNFNIATPKNYILAAGDEIILEVWGTSQRVSKIKISPEGSIYIDKVGSIILNGYTIEEAERKIKERLAGIYGGIDTDTFVKVSLGSLRTIKVNIVGEVNTPGTYTLSSLATLFNALYMAGGVNSIGTLRNIEVHRNNRKIATFDAYDFLINGKYDTNIRLEDNDVIIVPTYATHVWITGEVKRETGFEMKPNETLANLLKYAGDFNSEAYKNNVLVFRNNGSRLQLRTVERPDFSSFIIQDGDSVHVSKIIQLYENRVSISGAVWRPGNYELSSQTNTLSKLIAKAENLKGNEFASRGQVSRMRKDFTREIIPFNIYEIVNGETDMDLKPEDEIYIPTIGEMVEEFYVDVKGEVNNPQKLSFYHNMTIEDVIIMVGGLKESASLSNIEIARRIRDPKVQTYSNVIAQTFTFPISEVLGIDLATNGFKLQPFDEIYIRKSPVYKPQQSVSVTGEIIFSGNYVLSRSGERLSEVVERAGGVTPEAYIEGASLIRQVSDEEKMKIMTKLNISENGMGERDSIGNLPIFSKYIVGIDLKKALENKGGNDDIILRNGDLIYIPKMDNTVKISGAVLHSNSVSYEGKSLKEYISQAGGYKDNARKQPFIVYMNGKIASTRKGFLYKKYPKVKPGCEIIVPEKSMRPNRLSLPEILSITSSTTAIAAMVSNIVK